MQNKVQVVIGGRILTMTSSEDELHIQKVASCVNRMIQKVEGTQSYRALSSDLKPVLIELNLAEELIQAREQLKQLEADLQERENELAEVKQALAESDIRLERLEGKRRR